MQKLLISFLLAAIATSAYSATYTTPKREFRSAWIATVWALDWPRDANDNAANNTNATVQKQQMIRMLDSLKTTILIMCVSRFAPCAMPCTNPATNPGQVT